MPVMRLLCGLLCHFLLWFRINNMRRFVMRLLCGFSIAPIICGVYSFPAPRGKQSYLPVHNDE
jgi:hypothetical protein